MGIIGAVAGVCGTPEQVISGPCLKLFNLYVRSYYYLFVLFTQVYRCPGTETE